MSNVDKLALLYRTGDAFAAGRLAATLDAADVPVWRVNVEEPGGRELVELRVQREDLEHARRLVHGLHVPSAPPRPRFEPREPLPPAVRAVHAAPYGPPAPPAPRHYAPHETVLLYRARDLVEATLLVAHLEAEEIPAWTVGSGACFAFGDAPADALLVDVLVPREHHARAVDVVSAYFAGDAIGEAWTCAACGEVVEGGFETCWNCGAERADAPGPPSAARARALHEPSPTLVRGFFFVIGLGALCGLAALEGAWMLEMLGLDPKALRLVLTILVPVMIVLALLLGGPWVLGSSERERRDALARPARRY